MNEPNTGVQGRQHIWSEGYSMRGQTPVKQQEARTAGKCLLKMHKGDKCWLDIIMKLCKTQHACRTIGMSTTLQKGVQVQHISQVAQGKMSEKEIREKSYSRSLSSTTETLCHSDTTCCLRMADQLQPQQSLHLLCLSPGQDPAKSHTSLLCCWSHPSTCSRPASALWLPELLLP